MNPKAKKHHECCPSHVKAMVSSFDCTYCQVIKTAVQYELDQLIDESDFFRLGYKHGLEDARHA